MPSTAIDPAFKNVGKTPGLEIWRIESLKVILQDKKTHGKFFSGDSYIILHTIKTKHGKLEWNIHFWLGSNTTQDEAGTAAYKTVELDDSMGGFPVQYREVQGHESKKFLSLFPNGVQYLEGGVDSGFRKVDRDAYEKRLLHVKGKRNIRVQQVELSFKSLNHGDVFVLDDGKNIYCWNGKESSKRERVKGTEVARRIRDEERGGKARIHVIDSGKDNETRFFDALGSRGYIKSAEEGGDDAEFEKQTASEMTVYRVSDASGELVIEEAARAPLKQEYLDTNDCFIIDSGPGGVFSWIGKGCTQNEKKAAMQNAMTFIQKKGYPNWTQVTRIVEGGEPPIFKQLFVSWSEKNQQVGLGEMKKGNIAVVAQEEFDVTSLHNRAKKAKETLPDDGAGTLAVWRIEKFKKVDVEPAEHGIFYDGDCYVLLYTYKVKNREAYIVYYWQGLHSSIDEKGASAMYAQQIDDDLGGSPVQVRVVQNKEPEHFLRIFQGKMIILRGGIDSGFRTRRRSDSTRACEMVQLFHIRGTNELNTKAVEVTARAASLNSNDVFIMKAKEKAFIWEGSGASEEEKKFAEVVSDHVAPDGDLIIVREGKETKDFWDLIGGKEPYASAERMKATETSYPPRLFQCSNATGKFYVEEILDFDQEDLCEDDVMLLDTFEEVYVWIGKGANAIEKKEALNAAVNYIKSDQTGNRVVESTSILQVKQGYEPLNFTGYFMAWDPDKWSRGKTYEEIKRELGVENAGISSVQEELEKYNRKYRYEELIGKYIPDGVDLCNKERHLTDDDFQRVFKVTREKYLGLPKWKQTMLKKQVNLF